ncbi:MAG: glycosyltransferase family 2 protein [Candidatus Pacearchaeota archaeon]
MGLKNKTLISIILPCRNEEKALDFCLSNVKEVIKKNNLSAEIIVSDSSVDSSPEIAKRHKVVLVKHDKEGYGNAYLEGIKHSKGEYIMMLDADGTYDFNDIPLFISYLDKGYDFVIGDRFKGKMDKKCMPWSHKYIGNPILSGLLRFFFKTKVRDAHCGIRAIKKSSLKKLNLQTKGMEFASEMVIKAARNNLKIKEIPTNYYCRLGDSKLKSFRDGWRHLRFMLLYSPFFLFFIPGLILFLIGFFSFLWVYLNNPYLFGIVLFYHPLFLSSLFLISGYQLMIFSLFAKTYSINHLNDKPILNKYYKFISIESASIVGIFLILAGLIIYSFIFFYWIKGFKSFGLTETKNTILAFTLIILGIQTISSSFMLSILGIKK